LENKRPGVPQRGAAQSNRRRVIKIEMGVS
jgi:hypothetical protein